MLKNTILADVILSGDFKSKKEAKNYISAMVRFYRLLPSEYATAYYCAANGLLPDDFPAGNTDYEALHNFAKDVAIDSAHHWAFGMGEQDERPIREIECRAILFGDAIDKLLASDHDTWMKAAQAQK